MASNFWGELTGEAIRNLAENMFPGFYERGISANQALTELRGMGLGYRRTDFLNDFRQGESRYSLETRVKFLGAESVPSEGILSPQYHGVPDRYSCVFKGEGIDSVTGEETNQYFYYHRNSLDSKANMENDAFDWMSEQADVYGFEIDNVSIVEGYINPVWEGGD